MAHYNVNHICLCKQVSREKMEACIKEGATTVNLVKYKTGAGNGACKGIRCTPKIQALLEERTNHSE